MRILVGCEMSGRVREAFRAQGHYALSCDLLPTEIPGEHYQGDIFDVINDGFDLAIFHPPCTYLSYAGIKHFNIEKYGDKAIERHRLKDEAIEFFLKLWEAPIGRICIENPVGFINKVIKPTQIIHPYYFGEPYQKRTCLWLKNLPELEYSETIIAKPEPVYICQGEKCKGKKINWCEAMKTGKGRGTQEERAKERSRTFSGIANAMATQWNF
jgi:hypothetical protein